MSEKLKIGDKVFKHVNSRWHGESYEFGFVERLTKTQAVLDSEVRIINEPLSYKDGPVKYSEYGDTWSKWAISNPEVEAKAARIDELNKINQWFSRHNFTQLQKELIYNELNNVKKP